jgi:hypothetical protein
MAAAQGIVMRKQPVDLSPQRRQIRQIHEADGAAADLVLVGRADAALGRADAGCGILGLAQGLELAVQRQYQNCILGDAQRRRRHDDALFLELGNLVDERLGIDHHAIADDRQFAFAHDPGREQRQLVR